MAEHLYDSFLIVKDQLVAAIPRTATVNSDVTCEDRYPHPDKEITIRELVNISRRARAVHIPETQQYQLSSRKAVTIKYFFHSFPLIFHLIDVNPHFSSNSCISL
jgi:hypothetical protein